MSIHVFRFFALVDFSGVRIMCKFVIFQNGPLNSNADTHLNWAIVISTFDKQ